MPLSLVIIRPSFLIFANLIGRKWYLIVILNSIPFIVSVLISLLVSFNKFQVSINCLYFLRIFLCSYIVVGYFFICKTG